METATFEYAVRVTAALVAYAFAIRVIALGPRQRANRRLALVIFLEALLLTNEPFHSFERFGVDVPRPDAVMDSLPWFLAAAYVWLLTTLGTRLLRPLETRTGRAILVAYPILVSIVT